MGRFGTLPSFMFRDSHIIYTPFLVAAPPPRNIVAETISSSVIRIRWSALFLHCQTGMYNITGFVIAYKKVVEGDIEHWHRQAALPNSSYADVTSLSPYVSYTFRITAMTQAGLGIPSEYIDAYTMQGGTHILL